MQIAKNCQIKEVLGEGSVGLVYKALNLSTQQLVAVKIFSKQAGERSEAYLRFLRETSILTQLNHPNIIKLYEVGKMNNAPYVIMEYLEGSNLVEVLKEKGPLEINLVLDIMTQIVSSLAYVHERNIIHRDIKSGNVMVVDYKKRKVKVLDFCMARLMDVKEEEKMIGTVSYMSPEMAGMLDQPVDNRSDLYSVGVIMYELVTGRLPFVGKEIGKILHQHIAKKPELPSSLRKDLPLVLEKIILKLLEKNPKDRYQSANGLLYDLEEIRKALKAEKPVELISLGRRDVQGEMRYGVSMVGRDEEMKILEEWYERAEKGKGGIVDVVGEAGVGKTRLLNEFRGRVLNRGGVFVSGKNVGEGRNFPYGCFSEAISNLVVYIKNLEEGERKELIGLVVKKLEGMGAAITRVMPVVEDLIGTQKEEKQLDPEKERYRFYAAVWALLSVITEKGKPLVIFLDDLQWADESSLLLLKYLMPKVKDISLLLLGAYRSEEIGRKHPLAKVMADMEKIKVEKKEIALSPFTQGTLFVLIKGLFKGLENSDIDYLSQEIYERSEGNAFFVGEILRTLIEQRGLICGENRWEFDKLKFADITFSKNLIEVVLQRIKFLKEDHLDILSFAALIGREFEFEMLSHIGKLDVNKVLDALDEAMQYRIIWSRRKTGEYEFGHDKIREALYQRKSVEERRKIHLKIAEYLENKYQEDLSGVAYKLATHFSEAQDERARSYAVMAGEKAQGNYNFAEAIVFYEMALGLIKEKGSELWLKVTRNLADVYSYAGQYVKSLESYQKILPYIKDKLERGRVAVEISRVFTSRGEIEDARQVLEEAMKDLGIWVPKTNVGVLLALLWNVLLFGLRRILPSLLINMKPAKKNPKVELLFRVSLSLYFVYFFKMQIERMMLVHFKAMNVVERYGKCKEMSYVYTAQGLVFSFFAKFKQSLRFTNKALEIAQEVNSPDEIANALRIRGFCYLYSGDFENAERDIRKE